jgi:hypothetical protein
MRIVTRKPLKPSPIDRLIAQCYNVATNEGRAMKTTVKKDTPSSAYQLLMTKIAAEKTLPFNPLVPNAKSIEAMKAARQGDLIPVPSVADLFSDIDNDDD